MHLPDLQPKLVKSNPLIDLGTGATHVEVFDIGEYRQKHGALAAALKLRELRAEARRQYAWNQLKSTPRLRPSNNPPRRAARARAIKASPKAAPKRAARKTSRSPCHGRSEPGDGEPRPIEAIHPLVDTFAERYPDEFKHGFLSGLTGKPQQPCDAAGYPVGFHTWPLERRNAWYAARNAGNVERASHARL